MDNSFRALLSDTDEIQFLMHCAIESVRQNWVALTQGENEPTEADYDALWGTYHRLSQLDAEFLQNKEDLWDVFRRLSKDAESEASA